MSVAEYAQTLADYRANNVRASEDVLKKGIFILDNNGLRKLGDDGPFSPAALPVTVC